MPLSEKKIKDIEADIERMKIQKAKMEKFLGRKMS